MPKVFVDWPAFSSNSNGVLCLYELSLYLHKTGFSVYGVPRNLQHFLRAANRLPSKYREIPVVEKPFGSGCDFFVAADTAVAKTIQYVRQEKIQIVWWGLAPYRLLDGTQLPRVGEFSLPYSSYVDPSSEQYFYFQPEFDSDFKQALARCKSRQAPDRARMCLYTGKGRMTNLPEKILNFCKGFEIIPITRNAPSTRSQLFEILSSVDCMITFDELSAINLEAAAMGVPVFLANPLFPPVCRQKFSLSKLKQRVVNDVDEFLYLVSLRRENKLDSWTYEDLFVLNDATLAAWRQLLESPDKCERFIVKKDNIDRFRGHTKALRDQRVVSIHNGGQAGGAWLASRLIAKISMGNNSSTLMMAIRVLDYSYVCFWPLFLFIERLPVIRGFLAKKRRLSHSYVYGQRVFRL